MRTVRALLVGGVAFFVVGAGLAAHATPVPLPVGEAGLSVTIDGADTFRAGEPYTVSGSVLAVAALPVVVEVSHGVPDIDVSILIDGDWRASATTDDDGHYSASVTMTGEPATHTLQAVVLRGTPLAVTSPTRSTTVEQTFSALSLDPTTASLTVGGSQQLTALATDSQGRQQDVTAAATWTSSDPNVATVNGGVVQAVGPGSATVTATWDNLSAAATVDVTNNGR